MTPHPSPIDQIVAGIEAQRDSYQALIDDDLRAAGHHWGLPPTPGISDLEREAARLRDRADAIAHRAEHLRRLELRRDELSSALGFIRTTDDHDKPPKV